MRWPSGHSGFVIRHSFVIGHSSFVILTGATYVKPSRPALGQTLRIARNRHGVALHHRRADRQGRASQRGPARARHAVRQAGAPGAAVDPLPRPDRTGQEGGRPLSQRHAADGRRQAVAAGIRPPAVGLDRPARAHVRGEHAEELFRADPHGSDARRADPRARSQHSQPGVWRRKTRRGGQLPGAVARGGTGSPFQLARRTYPLAARHPHADRPRPQAGSARAVDALPHGVGLFRGRHPARSHFDLSRGRRHRSGRVGPLRPQHDLRRHGHGRAI